VNQKMPSCRYLPQFVKAVLGEVGQGSLANVLAKAGMPGEWVDFDHINMLGGIESARAYAGIQSALRTYYGRGARGTLIRTGRALWDRFMQEAPFAVKLRSGLARTLPPKARIQPALKVLTVLLGSQRGDVTVYPMDPDLLLIDRASPGTLGQSEGTPVCYVTLGLLHACLLWAAGVEYDIEEISCRANGGGACEFKILGGG
jgi:predicted hydrocarbon binding protein